ncbi:MAG TPA: phage minor head protein [Candidatus Eisenbacteria bacterium]|nr:phage minor head protein [Candidatus Eisenbacteria bacterium]
MIKRYSKLLDKNAERCARNYRRVYKTVTAAGELDDILNEDQLSEESKKALKAARDKIAREAAVAQAVQFGISFAVTSPYLKQLLEAHAGKQAERLVAGARDVVTRVLAESLEEGWSVPQTATAIREKLLELKKWQATMLARTDLISLKNGGSFAAALQLAESQPVYKQWVSARDDKVRPSHVEANGQVVKLDSPFQVGEARLSYPGDPEGPDGEVINCRCTQIYSDSPVAAVWTVTGAGWDESEHPRNPRGTETGGEFRGKLQIARYSELPEQLDLAMSATDPYSRDSYFVDWPEADKSMVSEMGGSMGQYWEWDGEEPIDVARLPNGNPAVEMLQVSDGELYTPSYRVRGIVTFQRGDDAVKANYFATDGQGIGPGRSLVRELAKIAKAEGKPLYGSPADERLRKQYERLGAVSQPDGSVRWDVGTLDRLTAAGWDEAEHPRHPGGTSEGGKFAPKEGGYDSGGFGPGGEMKPDANQAKYLKDGDVFKFAGEDPGGPDSIQWFRAEQRENGLYAIEIDGDNVFPLSGVIDEVEKLAPVHGVTGELEPVMPDSAEESANSSSHRLYDVTVDGEEWLAKRVDETKELEALRDHVEPGRDLERELAAQIIKEEIYNASPELKLDLRVAEVREANVAGLGHVVMSKRVPLTEDGEGFSSHNELSVGEARAMSLYDWVIGNTDRHLGNIMRAEGGKAVAIDQGLAFPAANRDSFGRFHVLEFRRDGGFPETGLHDAAMGDLHWPDSKQMEAIGGLQEDWERIDTRLRPYLNENERRAMWRRVEWVANAEGRLPTHDEWANGVVDETIQGYGYHPSVTLGQDEEASVGEVYDSRSEDDQAADFEARHNP